MVYYSPKPCATRRICLAEWPSRYVSPFPFPLFPQHATPVRHPVGSGGQPIFCPRRWRSWVRMTRNTLFGGLRQRYTVYCYCSLLRCLCCMGWISLLHGLEVLLLFAYCTVLRWSYCKIVRFTCCEVMRYVCRSILHRTSRCLPPCIATGGLHSTARGWSSIR